uniref:Uncharacterized protein n=1 Tax=Anguilla anguilla TaxID=7936 RepID=A0A0E9XZS2_ANGAN
MDVHLCTYLTCSYLISPQGHSDPKTQATW